MLAPSGAAVRRINGSLDPPPRTGAYAARQPNRRETFGVSGRYFFFVATVVSLIAVPGPDMLYVLGRSIAYGRRAGVFSSLGIAGGNCLLTLLVAVGFQAAFETWPTLFSVVKYAGILYLTYLAYRLIASEGAPQERSGPMSDSDWRAFSSGVVTSALNPKGLLFYFSILPQFFVAGTEPFWRHALVYGLTTAVLCFVLYSALGAAAVFGARRWAVGPKARKRLTQMSGLVLLAAVVTLFGTDWVVQE